MTGPACPRCGERATGLRSSKHLWLVLPCSHWATRDQARVLAEASEKAEGRT
jgi:hypothetical protein